MTHKRKPTARAWRLHGALLVMAERGINGERDNARERLAELVARYDFAQVERELQDRLKPQIEDASKCGRKLHGFMPPCVLSPGHDGSCEDGFGGYYTHGEYTP